MLRPFLFLSHHPASRLEPGYSAEAAVTLGEVVPLLAATAAQPDALLVVRDRLTACLRLPMSRGQRLRGAFALAAACDRLGDAPTALEWLDAALDEVTQVEASAAVPEIFYLRAEQHRALFEYSLAASDYRSCLTFLQLQDEPSEPLDPARELNILVRLAGVQFFRARFMDCQTLLNDAHTLLARLRSPGSDLAPARQEWAGVEWMQALVDQWKGAPEHALIHAMSAADVYQSSGSAGPSARIQFIVADIALDLCEAAAPSPESSQRQAFLAFADSYLERALSLARASGDHTGEALVLLGSARHARLRGHSGESLALIERVARTAIRSADVALIAQSLTALGDAFGARGEHETALNLYRETLDVLEDYDVPAFGARAYRALLRASELEGVDTTVWAYQ